MLASLQQTQPRAAGLLERLSIVVTLPSLALRWLVSHFAETLVAVHCQRSVIHLTVCIMYFVVLIARLGGHFKQPLLQCYKLHRQLLALINIYLA